jgi:hypothetical protein
MGVFKHGILDGKVRYEHRNGDVYYGDCVNGLYEGEGIYRYATGACNAVYIEAHIF